MKYDDPDWDDETCKCGAPGKPAHQCPYAADVGNNPDYQCNCCDKCRRNCAEDV